MPRNDEQQTRTLITDWAAAVHRGQMDRVLADDVDDIVMFDVPPPHDGVRGVTDCAGDARCDLAIPNRNFQRCDEYEND